MGSELLPFYFLELGEMRSSMIGVNFHLHGTTFPLFSVSITLGNEKEWGGGVNRDLCQFKGGYPSPLILLVLEFYDYIFPGVTFTRSVYVSRGYTFHFTCQLFGTSV